LLRRVQEAVYGSNKISCKSEERISKFIQELPDHQSKIYSLSKWGAAVWRECVCELDENPVMTFLIKKRINTELLLIDGGIPLYWRDLDQGCDE